MSRLSDPNVSNGTCYYAVNKEAKGKLRPCGNVAIGHWPCCYEGDDCLGFTGANACYDSETANTYMAGCTDSAFASRACPRRPELFAQQEWTAIQQCSLGTGANDTVWGGCISNGTQPLKLPHASCDPYCATTVLVGPSTIAKYASLPTTSRGYVVYASGFDPMGTAADTPTRATQTHHLTSTQTPTGSPSSLPSSDSASEVLSTGAKVGIGVGVLLGAVLVAVAVLVVMHARRRMHRSKKDIPGK